MLRRRTRFLVWVDPGLVVGIVSSVLLGVVGSLLGTSFPLLGIYPMSVGTSSPLLGGGVSVNVIVLEEVIEEVIVEVGIRVRELVGGILSKRKE